MKGKDEVDLEEYGSLAVVDSFFGVSSCLAS